MIRSFTFSIFAFFTSLFLLLQASPALAIPTTLIQQPRMMGMGGAGVGLADDEYALFNNPAGLAGQEARRFRLLGLTAEASLDTVGLSGTATTAFRSFSVNSMNSFIGKDIFMRGGVTPMVTLPHFAIAYVTDFQGAINGYSVANPSFDLGYMTTHGVQAGMGWKIKRGRRATDEFRVGIAAKMLFRRGGYYTVNTAGFLAATSTGKAYIDNLVGQYGTGAGADLGVQYVKSFGKAGQLSAGASGTDFTTTKFSDGHASPIPPRWNLGVGYKRDLQMLKFSFAADLRSLNHSTALSNKIHLGAEVGIPFFRFYLGANQLNLTYGMAFDLWVMRISALSYGEEIGTYYHQNYSRRYMIGIDVNLPI